MGVSCALTWLSQPGFTRDVLGVLLILVGGFNHLEKYESQWEG